MKNERERKKNGMNRDSSVCTKPKIVVVTPFAWQAAVATHIPEIKYSGLGFADEGSQRNPAFIVREGIDADCR